MSGVAVAIIPPDELLFEISRTLFWQGRRGLWSEWVSTLPSEFKARLLALERAEAEKAKEQAERVRGGEPVAGPKAAPVMASWFPRQRCN